MTSFKNSINGFSHSYLTNIIEELEISQDFEPTVRRFAVALRATELGISEIHFYVIAAHAGLRRIEAKVGGKG